MRKYILFFIMFIGIYSYYMIPTSKTEFTYNQTRTTATIVAVGDNLIHGGLYKSGMNSNPWNYDHIYQYVKDEISSADLAIVNQETIFVEDHKDVSNHPLFGTPKEFGDALVKCGFDVVLNATNHTYDKGSKSIYFTMDYWNKKYPDISILGIHKSEEEANKICVRDVNGIKIAMLNYTYGLNGSYPKEKYLVDIFDKDRITKQIEEAKKISDIIIFFGHLGKEYETEVDKETLEWIDFLCDQKVDIIVCSHPHVLRTYEKKENTLIYYSLGNFAGTQETLIRTLGGMAKFTIEKTTVNNKSYIRILDDYTLKPLVTHFDFKKYKYGIYFLEDYTDELASQLSINEKATVEKYWDLYNSIIDKSH